MLEPSNLESDKTGYVLPLVYLTAYSFSALLILLIIYFVLSTLIVSVLVGPQQFFSKQIYSLNSPDSKFALNISRKVNFPVTDILGPGGTVNINLIEKSDQREIDSIEFYIHEFNQLTEPKVDWESNNVQIKEIAEYKNFAVKFQFPER